MMDRREGGQGRFFYLFNLDKVGHPYRANKNDRSICSLKLKYTTAIVRKVTRDVHEDVRKT
jgi:hypothetical protein